MKRSLSDWLAWQEQLHLSEIDLGLARIRQVAEKLSILSPSFPIITVAGTNGKGSSVALLESILRAHGYKTGAYTSPHLLTYNERIAINNVPASDAQICRAFEKIDQARQNISLTYFEFSTLAAMLCFIEEQVDVVILEVGLGGRLDASNLWDATLAIITGIAIDHVNWLGNDRETIGIEKSGIMRKNRPVISGDPHPPKSIKEEATRIGAKLYQINTDFSYTLSTQKLSNQQLSSQNEPLYHPQWQWQGWNNQSISLPVPALQGEFQINNAATVIAGLLSVKEPLPVSHNAMLQGLSTVSILGRMQILQPRTDKNPEWLLDVAHNPQSAEQLANYLKSNPIKGKTHAIFSMLVDKDISQVINLMDSSIDTWHLVGLEGNRGLSTTELTETFNTNKIKMNNASSNKDLQSHTSFDEVCKHLINSIKIEDRVVAFGSFLVVSGVLDVCKFNDK